MCLTKPVQIKKIKGQKAQLADGRLAAVSHLPRVAVGDWVLVNADFAVAKISPKEAKEILNYFKQ